MYNNNNNNNNNYSTTITDIPSTEKHEQSNRNESPISEDRNTPTPNNTAQTLTKEQKINLKNLKKIMNERKITLPSLRNREWRTIKMETKKINQIIRYIPTKSIIEWNELIYAGGKSICEKIGILLKSMNKKSKPWWEIRLETQIRKLRKQAKMIKQRKNAGICLDKKEKKATQEKITVQFEEINQKILVKEERLKRSRQRIKEHGQNRTLQNKERKFYKQVGGDDRKIHHKPGAREAEKFWSKIWQPREQKSRMD